jgi:cytochrome c oxidase assembly factor CtaG
MPPFMAILYLFAGGTANSILGIILTFAPAPIYVGYLHPEDELGALPLIRGKWGLGPLEDQALGGALMWSIGSLIFLWGILGVFVHWFTAPEPDEEETARPRPASAVPGTVGQPGGEASG